jgi:hypothetical protein
LKKVIVMALSKRSVPVLGGTLGGMVLMAALAMSPAVADTAPPAPPLAGGGCSAVARVEAQWGSGTAGGQIVSVVVTNTSATTATKWAVAWTLGTGQRVVSAWNAAVTTTGGAATAVNAAYNGVLAPEASTTFGMQLSGVASAPSLGCDNGTTTPTSSAPPPGGAEVTVSTVDNRSTVRLHVGDTLVVSLTNLHLPPKLSAPGVLVQRDVVGGYPTDQPLVAHYVAAAAGTVDVSTTTDIACNHEPIPCPSPQAPWTVHIVVTA